MSTSINSFNTLVSALLPLPKPRSPPSPTLISTLTSLHSLATTYILNPHQSVATTQHATTELRTRCSPWLVKVLAVLTEEEEEEEEGGVDAERTVTLAAELLSILAGRAAMTAVEREWVFENAGELSVREMGFGDAGLGFQTWGAGVVLARLLDSGSLPLNNASRVLELGSGTGLAGLVCARIGQEAAAKRSTDFRITMTDYDSTVLSNLVHNAASNDLTTTVAVHKLDWTDGVMWDSHPTQQQEYPLIIASDCAYDISHARHIPRVVDSYLAKHTPHARFWCVLPVRNRFDGELEAFVKAMRASSQLVKVADQCRTIVYDDDVEYRVLCYRRPVITDSIV
ncbi:hypothetical protein PhCBS80983_g02574 [Powellomyces hirtus]|uniref:FAM86 N-terminal domain-containing protein n=1 Tax=Powellomyces hirtus TaxID=109895 RepID=A0A507E763_9FUNG|nr:hypothetical protein PhCBS80983_g02574 [Powellomyces hirtus]